MLLLAQYVEYRNMCYLFQLDLVSSGPFSYWPANFVTVPCIHPIKDVFSVVLVVIFGF